MPRPQKGERREQILQTLVRMLEEKQGRSITTATLAKEVGVSEAALYRHFSGKEEMFEALIIFVEEAIFTRVNLILEEQKGAAARIQQIMLLVLGFADKNPGISRLLQGDALVGETVRLRDRMAQVHDRLETQLRQILRAAGIDGVTRRSVTASARLLSAVLEGHIARFVRSGFKQSPIDGWNEQWEMLQETIFSAG
jgi:TetR/AcrR family transcriptional regulator